MFAMGVTRASHRGAPTMCALPFDTLSHAQAISLAQNHLDSAVVFNLTSERERAAQDKLIYKSAGFLETKMTL